MKSSGSTISPNSSSGSWQGPEQSTLDDADFDFYRGEYERLRALLEESSQASALPEAPSARAALDDLLIRLRLNSGQNHLR